MFKSRQILIIVVLVLTGLLVLTGCGSKEDDKEFFNGKKVTLMVPYSPGAGNDIYCRTLAPHLSKHLGANSVVVENNPGAGGIVGRNKLYQSVPDGLTIAIDNLAGSILVQWAEAEGVAYKSAELSYIGKLNTEPHILIASNKSGIKTINDIIAKKEATAAFTGIGSDDYYFLQLLAQAHGFKVKVITGFKGSAETTGSVIKGEVDLEMGSLTSRKAAIKNKDVVPVMFFSKERHPDYPDVPTAFENVPDEWKKALEGFLTVCSVDYVITAPPKVSAGKLAVLRKALEDTVKDPAFLADAEKAKKEIRFVSGEETEKRVKLVLAMEKELKEVAKKILETTAK